MKQYINPKNLEKKAFTPYHEDGILDIVVGFYMLFFGIGMFVDMAWLPAVICPVVLVFWVLMKKSVTIPWIGNVKFSVHHTAQLRTAISTSGIAFFFTILILTGIWMKKISGTTPLWVTTFLGEYLLVVYGAVGTVLFMVTAQILWITRFYAYAVLALVFFLSGHFLGISGILLVIALGAAIMSGGLLVPLQFVRKYTVIGFQRGD